MRDATPKTEREANILSADAAKRAARYASYVFWLMFSINFINYLDRWVFAGLSTVIQLDLRLDDFQLGLLVSAFLLVYTAVALPLGFLADRISRKGIVAAGVAVWSLATAFTGLAGNFASLLVTRAVLGISEGSYYPAGTPMLAAYFPPTRRARVLSRWSVGALIGAAVGFVLAAPFASTKPLFIPGVAAWRYAFFFTGIPGLIFAFLIWRTREKLRHEDDPPVPTTHDTRTVWQRLTTYLRIPTVRVIIGTHALGFFALTGVTGFLPIYLNNTYGAVVAKHDRYGQIMGATPGAYPHAGLSLGTIAILAGGLVVIGGVLGNFFGGNLADRLSKSLPGGRVMTGGIGFLAAMPCIVISLGAPYVLRAIPAYVHSSEGTQVGIGVTIFAIFALLGAFCLNIYNGPLSAALLDVVPPDERGAAGGTELTTAHLLGDVYAGALIGAIAVGLNHALGGEQVGLALLLTCPVALLGSGIIGIWGSRFYERDKAAVGAANVANGVADTAPAVHI